MAQAARDENYVASALGVSDADSVTTLPLRVDPVTNRLLIDLSVNTNTAPPTLPTNAERDDNFVPVGLGVTDDSNLTPTPILIDSRTGYLWADVIVE